MRGNIVSAVMAAIVAAPHVAHACHEFVLQDSFPDVIISARALDAKTDMMSKVAKVSCVGCIDCVCVCVRVCI